MPQRQKGKLLKICVNNNYMNSKQKALSKVGEKKKSSWDWAKNSVYKKPHSYLPSSAHYDSHKKRYPDRYKEQ